MSNEFGHVQTESLIYNTIKKTLHVSHILVLVPFKYNSTDPVLRCLRCTGSSCHCEEKRIKR